MSRHEIIKAFDLIMRLLLLIFWKLNGTNPPNSLYDDVFKEYNEFMEKIPFKKQ